jgi:hypothetical protein
MKKLLKVLLKQLKGMMECVLVFTVTLLEICVVPVVIIERKINAVANYILKKYERI